MSIADLVLLLSPSQWIEVLVVLTTGESIRRSVSKMRSLTDFAHSKAGRIRPESMPATFLGRTITPLHALATFIPPVVYIGALALNGFRQPWWIAQFALPTGGVDATWQYALRAGACLASFANMRFVDYTFAHLGDQWHVIGRREKSRVVKTGPYAWVRHPGYSSVLLQQALSSVMFWSYIPLASLGIIAAAFAVKMPIEESLILKDDAVKDEYRQYMKQVPARVLPGIW